MTLVEPTWSMDPAAPSMPLHVGSLPLSIARRSPFPFPRATASIAAGPLDASISIASEPAGERENSTESLASLDEASVVHVQVFTAIHGRFPGELHVSCPSSSLVSFFVYPCLDARLSLSALSSSANRRILCGTRSQLGCTFSNPRGSFEVLLQHRSDRGSSSQERRSLPQESEPNRRWKERPCARAARARDRSKAQNGTPRRG